MMLSKQNGIGRSKVLLFLSATITVIMLVAGFLLLSLVQTDHVTAATMDAEQWLPVYDLTNNDGLTVRMQSDVTSTFPGSTLRYTMTVTNNATITTTNFTAVVRIPKNTTYVSDTVTTQFISTLITQTTQSSAYYDPFNNIKWAGKLALKTIVHIRFAVKVKEESNCPDNITMTGEIHLPQFAPDITNTRFVELNCIPALQLTHTSNVTTTAFFGVIEYQVAIHNSSPVTVNNLILTTTLPLPHETTYLTDTLRASHGKATYRYEQHAVYWQGAIAPQGNVLLTYTLQITRFGTCKTLNSHAYLIAPTLWEVHSAVAKVEYRCPRIEVLQFSSQSNLTETSPGGIIDYQLTITNPSDLPTDIFQVFSAIPIGAIYVPGSATATNGPLIYNPTTKEQTWSGVVPERSTMQLRFQLRIQDRVRCGAVITSQATVFNTGLITPINPTVQSAVAVNCMETQPWTDFGDAPDSESNHHGLNNTAYQETGVLGRFPTVWEGTPPGEGSGPTHRIDHFWLGSDIDAEVDADLTLNDESEPWRTDTNILNNGDNGIEDVADFDFNDDGWKNPFVPMLNCETSTLLVRVSRSALPTSLEEIWLNVWFDGNRDGDWQDSGDCPASPNPLGGKSFEWIVQDWAIDTSQIAAGDFLDLQIPTKLVYNPNAVPRVWVRFTLSEQRALRPTAVALADGRGPRHPAFFQIGETEDYLVDGLPQGEPIQVSLQQFTDNEITPTVQIGSKAGFGFFIKPTAGTRPATTLFQNNLPPGVTLAGPPEFMVSSNDLGEDYDGATPLAITFLPNEGPSGRIEWHGRLRREVGIWIYYELEVNACPPPDADGQSRLRNSAQVQQPDGTIVTTEPTYLVDCIPTGSGDSWLFLPLVNR